MKTNTKLFVACLIVGYIGLFAFNCSAQTYKVVDGKVIITEKAKTVKQPDKVVAITAKGDTIFQGSKGGVYQWKTSAAGKRYKAYLKKEQ